MSHPAISGKLAWSQLPKCFSPSLRRRQASPERDRSCMEEWMILLCGWSASSITQALTSLGLVEQALITNAKKSADACMKLEYILYFGKLGLSRPSTPSIFQPKCRRNRYRHSIRYKCFQIYYSAFWFIFVFDCSTHEPCCVAKLAR